MFNMESDKWTTSQFVLCSDNFHRDRSFQRGSTHCSLNF